MHKILIYLNRELLTAASKFTQNDCLHSWGMGGIFQ